MLKHYYENNRNDPGLRILFEYQDKNHEGSTVLVNNLYLLRLSEINEGMWDHYIHDTHKDKVSKYIRGLRAKEVTNMTRGLDGKMTLRMNLPKDISRVPVALSHVFSKLFENTHEHVEATGELVETQVSFYGLPEHCVKYANSK